MGNAFTQAFWRALFDLLNTKNKTIRQPQFVIFSILCPSRPKRQAHSIFFIRLVLCSIFDCIFLLIAFRDNNNTISTLAMQLQFPSPSSGSLFNLDQCSHFKVSYTNVVFHNARDHFECICDAIDEQSTALQANKY